MGHSNRTKIALGDFQTPSWFCQQVCARLVNRGFHPASLLEPTCGQGNFLLAALDHFPLAKTALGTDINAKHIAWLQRQVASRPDQEKIVVFQADFFHTNWSQIVSELPAPLLIIGNPPWVTNAQLSTIGSENRPQKSNIHHYSGIEALTGVSNFDISEWMLLKICAWADEKPALVAMLCKTSVARKVLSQRWGQSSASGVAQIVLIDAQKIFGVSVDACLFIYDTTRLSSTKSCQVFGSFFDDALLSEMGYQDGQIVANLEYYERWKHLQNNREEPNRYRWRSGIKHDCASVMELTKIGEQFANKLGEVYELEETYVYPLLKGADLGQQGIKRQGRWMLVTQRCIGENTLTIKTNAPKTWDYLVAHRDYFDKRKSSVYKTRPPYSIFGVGDYAFAPWKVAISGFHKRLHFVVVEPFEDKPTVLDDTCYFLPCQSKEEAALITQQLNAEVAQQFYQSFIFWDTKRPITAKILNRLNIATLAQTLESTT